ncbi:adenosylmethionine decarboxylase [Salvia divinorum]|uniref:S-adenosylmethionine decarboxylase proenzyme n=1 Tax=Salvia divinorum TaxID=28513 RepID=A0ABD1G4L2_SALDI
MAASGFEGFEKRIELRFSGHDPASGKGLRQLDFFTLEKVLHAVQCTVVSALGNRYFDAYVLSESSLFVYPTKIIIKTCGTTQLLKSVRPFVHFGATIGLALCSCRYTRGSFIFPDAQPHPHTSFRQEVSYLEENLPPNLSIKKASVMNAASSHKWHVFTACDEGRTVGGARAADDFYTVEICMTGLDPVHARKFFRRFGFVKTGDSAGREMTEATGIDGVNASALVCDHAFDPCGYSMNGVDGNRYSTVHVTPEDGFSYASFECVYSSIGSEREILEAVRKVAEIFRPAELSVATTGAAGEEVWRGLAGAVGPVGLGLTSCAADEFPDAGIVVFQMFGARRE